MLPNAGEVDEYNLPTQPQEPVTVVCSFTDTPNAGSWESWLSSHDIQKIDAEIRFFPPPIPDKSVKVKLVKVLGKKADPINYEVVGIRNLGEFGYVCALRAVVL